MERKYCYVLLLLRIHTTRGTPGRSRDTPPLGGEGGVPPGVLTWIFPCKTHVSGNPLLGHIFTPGAHPHRPAFRHDTVICGETTCAKTYVSKLWVPGCVQLRNSQMSEGIYKYLLCFLTLIQQLEFQSNSPNLIFHCVFRSTTNHAP